MRSRERQCLRHLTARRWLQLRPLLVSCNEFAGTPIEVPLDGLCNYVLAVSLAVSALKRRWERHQTANRRQYARALILKLNLFAFPRNERRTSWMSLGYSRWWRLVHRSRGRVGWVRSAALQWTGCEGSARPRPGCWVSAATCNIGQREVTHWSSWQSFSWSPTVRYRDYTLFEYGENMKTKDAGSSEISIIIDRTPRRHIFSYSHENLKSHQL
jgi:hypothetical protein